MPPRNDLAQGVATGAIGAGYGPYSVRLYYRKSFDDVSDRMATQAPPRGGPR
jgi:hypothetical protein